jgi:hypothetical protein
MSIGVTAALATCIAIYSFCDIVYNLIFSSTRLPWCPCHRHQAMLNKVQEYMAPDQ